MPSTRRKNVKARKSREADILSDIENMDVMIGSPHFGDLDDDIRNEHANGDRNDTQSSSQENEIGSENRSGGHAQPSTTENIESRFENMTSELNARLYQELDRR